MADNDLPTCKKCGAAMNHKAQHEAWHEWLAEKLDDDGPTPIERSGKVWAF